MKRAAIPFAVAIVVASGIALAQGTEDRMAQLRACSPMEGAERLECLDNVSRSIAPERHEAPKTDNWMVSETTSPVDYSPIATATTFSRDGPSEIRDEALNSLPRRADRTGGRGTRHLRPQRRLRDFLSHQ
jgi:hypothetical protein